MVDRLDGVNEGLGRKAPVRCGTTANITLSGFQTLDGITPVSTDTNLRVLVKNQTTASQNGIYDMASSTWTRALDFNGNRDFRRGTMVVVTQGSTLAASEWYVSSADPMVVDTDSISWTQFVGASGGVSSVALTMPTAVFDVAGSPVTSSGTFTVTFDTQTANTVFCGPSSGAVATPTFRALVAADIPSNPKIVGINFVIDGGGSTLTTGIKGDLEIPFACTITSVTLLADQSGSIVVDIWKDTYANYPPTDADSITAAAVPTITTATKSQDTTLTGWTTSVTAGNTLRFNVDSVTSLTRCTVSLTATLT